MKKKIIMSFIVAMSCCISSASIMKGSQAAFQIGKMQCNNESFTAKDYIQDGLISHLDGIENAGYDIHDDNVHIWINLKDTGTSFENSSILTGKDYVLVNANIMSHMMTSYERQTLNSECDYTIEFLAEAGDTSWISMFTVYGGNPRTHTVRFMIFPKRIYYRNAVVSQSSPNMNIGETCLFTFVRKGAKGYGYLNGELVSMKDIDNLQDAYAMYMYTSKHKFKNIRIYERALTSEEIAFNWHVDAVRFKNK